MKASSLMARASFFLTLGFALSGCSTIEGVLDTGRGPFDRSPASASEAALEGLHESSWGNSGKWGGEQTPRTDLEETDSDQDDPPNG